MNFVKGKKSWFLGDIVHASGVSTYSIPTVPKPRFFEEIARLAGGFGRRTRNQFAAG